MWFALVGVFIVSSVLTFPPTALAKNSNVNRKHLSRIESYINATAWPCDNFYRYACGNWPKVHKDLEYGDTLSLMDYEVCSKLEKLLRKPIANRTDSNDIYTKVRRYYQTCKKVKPYQLKKYLQQVPPCDNCTWPIFHRQSRNPWATKNFNWVHSVANLRRYGLNEVFLEEKVMPRWDDTTTNIIYLDRPSVVTLQPHSLAEIVDLICRLDVPKRIASVIAQQIHAFEVELVKLIAIEDENGAQEMVFEYLCEIFPQIDWQMFLSKIVGHEIHPKYPLIIQNTPYMVKLTELINRTKESTICHYIMIKFVDHLVSEGPQEISKIDCIANLRHSMPLAMSYIVGHNFYNGSGDTAGAVQSIFNRLKTRFLEEITKNSLQLNAAEVGFLQKKITEMKIQIGNVPANATIDFYNEYYSSATINDNFYTNQLRMLRLRSEKEHASLENHAQTSHDSYIEHHWSGSSSSPFYVKTRNLIIVPFGFIQLPVFHKKLHNVFKFSVLGFILGHEMLHGFDATGIEYDHLGNMMGPIEEITANENFSQRLQCMQMEQTAAAKSLNEKIADYSGFRLTYETFFFRGDEEIPQMYSNSTTLTNKMLFFLNFAQFFCGKLPKGGAVNQPLTDHDLDEVRVVQTLMNFEEFSKEFKCKKAMQMNKESKCQLW